MSNAKLIRHGLIHSLGIVVYVMWVVIIMNNGEKLFGTMDNVWGPLAFLLLFTVSAGVVGLLVFGRPAYLLLSGQKTEGVKLALYTMGFLFLETALFLVGLALFK